MRRKFYNTPDLITETYMSKVLQNLGVTDARQIWHLKEFSRKLKPQFGRMNGLWRCHYAVSEALQMFVEGHTSHGIAMLVQVSKAMHQAGINQGSWEIGALLIPTEDPLGRVEFGGDAEEMYSIQSYRRSLRDLRVAMLKTPSGPDGEENTSAAPKAGAKKKGKKWKEDNQEDK